MTDFLRDIGFAFLLVVVNTWEELARIWPGHDP